MVFSNRLEIHLSSKSNMLQKLWYSYLILKICIIKLLVIDFVAMAPSQTFFMFFFSFLDCEHRNYQEVIASEMLLSVDTKINDLGVCLA